MRIKSIKAAGLDVYQHCVATSKERQIRNFNDFLIAFLSFLFKKYFFGTSMTY